MSGHWPVPCLLAKNSSVEQCRWTNKLNSRPFARSHPSLGHSAVHPIIQKVQFWKVWISHLVLVLGPLPVMPTLLLSTPAKNTRNSATKFAAITQPLNELCNNMDSEMRKCFVGPMPVRDFLGTFLPVQPPPVRWGRSPEFGMIAGLRLESQMYNEFVRSFHHHPGFNTSDFYAHRPGLRTRSAAGSKDRKSVV